MALGDEQEADLRATAQTFKRPQALLADDFNLVALGKSLFWDARLSASGTTSCGTCHHPDLAWATGEAKSRNDSGKLTSRKSQPLIGIAYAAHTLVGWDGRNPSLEAQARSSVASGSMSMRDTENPVKAEIIEARFRSDPEYVRRFEAVMPGQPINLDTIATALAAYERTIEPGSAPFDRWLDGQSSAISESAKRGFAVFTSKAACFVCHTGWRFTDDKFHDIGTSTGDLGRGRDVKDEVEMQFAFKTPTLRSVAVRAPYFHDGSAPTLSDVIRHYERGGIERPSRSPAIFALDLSDQDRADLVSFLEALTGDEDGGAARPDRN